MRVRTCLPAPGFTLVELLVFIVMIAVAAVGLLMSMRYAMPRSTAGATNVQAVEVAQMRMELILAQKDTDMYQYMSDPCLGGTPISTLCTNPLGFNVTVTGISSATAWTSLTSAAYKLVTVTVKDSTNTTTLASMTSLVANY